MNMELFQPEKKLAVTLPLHFFLVTLQIEFHVSSFSHSSEKRENEFQK
jgi:hypothetical protein